MQKLIYLFFFIFILGCGLAVTRPKLEMSMAAAAFTAAKKSNAEVLASNLFRKAEMYFIKAKSAYRRKYFVKAKQYAILSKKFSEKAEFTSVRKTTLESDGKPPSATVAPPSSEAPPAEAEAGGEGDAPAGGPPPDDAPPADAPAEGDN